LINCMYASVKEEARHQPSGCTFQKVSWIIPNRDIFSRQSRFFFIRDFGTWWFWRVLWFWSWHDCSSIQFGFLDFLLPYTRSICGALGVIMHETINESDVNIIVKEFTQSFRYLVTCCSQLVNGIALGQNSWSEQSAIATITYYVFYLSSIYTYFILPLCSLPDAAVCVDDSHYNILA